MIPVHFFKLLSNSFSVILRVLNKLNQTQKEIFMCNKTIDMSKLKQLLLMRKTGESNRQIAKNLGINKETVNEYVLKLKSIDIKIDDLVKLDEPILEGKFFAGNPAYTDPRYETLKELLPHFEKELERKHVTRYLLWKEYLSKYPSGYRYTQFCYHLNQQLVARNPTAVLTHVAGEKLFVDFAGDKLEYIDRATGEVKKVNVFVACLPYSDYTFIMAVEHQTTEDFLKALACCLKHLGGCPKILVPDNLKAAVIKSDPYEPKLNTVMEDFANHYGFTVIPARVARPKDKAKVENQVKIIYSRVYAKLRNHHFFSLEELNEALEEKILEHNQTRMQKRDYSRMEKFLADEKQHLCPLPQTDFEIKIYAELTVDRNNHIYFARDKHYYSVPYIHIQKKVQVIYTHTLVKIFWNHELIATHQRVIGFGYSTNKEHLCSTHRHYNDRNPDYYIEKAKAISELLVEVMKNIFSGSKPPEVYYKTCNGLLFLYKQTEHEHFEKACKIVLKVNNFRYSYFKSLVEQKSLLVETEQHKSLPFIEENIRGKIYYQ